MGPTGSYDNELGEGQVVSEVLDSGTLATLNKSEIDQQITTAKKWPRSIKRFRDECLQMVTLSTSVANSCIYALPRKDSDGHTKNIEGPSARFAEVVASAWGNCRAGARVVSEDDVFVTAQGAFYDLERNVAISYEVRRRITDKNGKKYKADMIGVTSNAACSIALRNAILKGVPKAFWSDMYDAAKKTVVGDIKSLNAKRLEALDQFQKIGVSKEMVLNALGLRGSEDISIDNLVTLHGFMNAIREGESTIEDIFLRTDTQSIPMPQRQQSSTQQEQPAAFFSKIVGGAGAAPAENLDAEPLADGLPNPFGPPVMHEEDFKLEPPPEPPVQDVDFITNSELKRLMAIAKSGRFLGKTSSMAEEKIKEHCRVDSLSKIRRSDLDNLLAWCGSDSLKIR